jgi:hypothetical protein
MLSRSLHHSLDHASRNAGTAAVLADAVAECQQMPQSKSTCLFGQPCLRNIYIEYYDRTHCTQNNFKGIARVFE